MDSIEQRIVVVLIPSNDEMSVDAKLQKLSSSSGRH